MSALPPDDMRKLHQTAFAARHPIDAMLARWDSIQHTSAILATLAGLGEDKLTNDPVRLPELLVNAADWQRELAWQAVEDIAVMLDAGMAALDVLAARGKDGRIPAMALWREVDAAQRSVLAVLETHGETASAPAP